MKTTTAVLIGLSLLTAACSPAASPQISSVESNAAQISSVESNAAMTATAQPAIITVTSPHSFEQTTARVAAAIEKRPLNLFAKIDHAAGAAKADLTLAPQMGIVLPLKMHVYQDGGDVKISYTDIAAESKLHGLDSEQLPVPNIVKMLSGLAAEVTTP